MGSSVLVVSSDALFSHLIVKSLARQDISAKATNSFIDALSSVAGCQLAIVDLNFAGIEGRGLVRALSARSGVPILAMSEENEASIRTAAIEAGAADTMCKAYLPDELIARVRGLLLDAELPRTAVAA